MIPGITAVRLSGARHRSELPLLVLGPALGTSAQALWSACAAGLTDVVDVLAWDLPGHGHNRPAPDEGFTMAELAAGVLRVVDDVLAQRGELKGPFLYAGVSVGGGVGLQLLLDAPHRVAGAVLLCTGARIGTPELWAGRREQVSASGTAAMIPGSTERWFGPGFLAREPARGATLLQALEHTDDLGYVQVCTALADFDVRRRLAEVRAPVLAVAGAADVATPPGLLAEIAAGVRHGRYVELDGIAHLAPAEAPEVVARLVREHLLGETPPTAETVRPAGLDARSSALVALTLTVARAQHEQVAARVREARVHGVTLDEVTELIEQVASSVEEDEAAGSLRIARAVFDEPAPG